MSKLEYLTDKEYINKITTSKQEKCLEIALDIRKFEIDLYWKRATYFWAFAASIIALMVLCFRNPNFNNDQFYQVSLLLLNSLLIVISYIWYLASKGSKYWQENWEQHVVALEESVMGPFYKSFLLVNKRNFPDSILQGMPYSVSKLSMCLSLVMILVWLSLHFVILIFTPLPFEYVVSLMFIFIVCFFINKYGRFSYFNEVVIGENEGSYNSFGIPKKNKV